MRVYNRVVCGVACGLLLINLQAPRALGANAYPVFTDINIGAQAFGVANASEFGGIYTLSDTATLNGNAVLQINQNGHLACCHGALIEANVSNGENGVNSTNGGANVDIPNATPPNPVFAAIGNASGKLENGNVIRFSVWFRSDPANPITLDPQVQPILKIEYWKEALSTFADSNMQQAAPQFGDRVFDQDQQGNALGIPDLPHWVDLNGDGVVLDASATVGNGRVTQTTTSEWRLAEVTHTVNSADWLGIGAEAFGANDLNAIESVKGVMFMGDFNNTDLTGDGPDGGNLLVDNALMEVFKNAAAVTPNTNPNPSLSEGLAGDYNHDNKVDAADYVLWRKDPASFGGNPAGYNTWRSNFGNPPGSGLGSGAVPEPSAIMLAAAAALALMAANRRR
jgi:PEP-CTERM motif